MAREHLNQGKRPRWHRLRDWIGWRIANFALNHIATQWYRDRIGGAIAYGMSAAAQDVDPRVIVFDHIKGEVYRGSGPLGY